MNKEDMEQQSHDYYIKDWCIKHHLSIVGGHETLHSGTSRSSDMILDAEHWARDRWGNIRAYTYVDAHKVKSHNPGYCYKMAGWKAVGTTKGGLLILEKNL